MTLLKLLICINKILALYKYIHNPERISLIVDTPIGKILNEDGSKPTGILLKEDVEKNDKANKFLWDKYYPKAFFYFIEFENLSNLKIMSKLKLKCLSNEKEEIFSFEINMKLNNLSFFTGNENVKLFVKKREKATNEYIIGCNPRHYQNLLNVFDYINLIETIPPHHSNLIMILNILKQNLRIILQESKKLFKNDKSIFFKIWEINRAATKIYISFIKSLVTLKIPSLNKLEYLEPFEQFMVKKDALFELMKDLKEMIFAELANNYQYNIKDEYYVIHNFYENLILFINDFEKNYGNTINEKYNQFFNNLSSVTEFSEKIKNKPNKNTQFTFDSEDKTVEKFIDNHYFLFLEYCDIMGSCDEVYLDEYLYNKSLMISGTYRKVSEEMFFDIVVAKEMKKYLEIYKCDKTDFLTFARTYYFKNKLFDKILDNLNTLNSSLLFNERADNIYEKTVVLSQEDQNLISRIENLKKKLVPIFNLWPKTKSRSISEDNENTSINMHQNLSENKTQISNENQMNDEKNLDRSEENETDQNGDISILKDSNESDGENFSDQSKQDESQSASNEQKEDETTLLYVTEIDNDKNIEKAASLKEKSQESEDFNKEKYEREYLKSENLFINDEISTEKNYKYNLNHSKSLRNKINDDQDKKTESGLIIKQNINDESKLKNETKFNEYTSQIYCNEKQTINTHNNEKSNTEGYYIFHLVLVMFAAVSLIGLFVFCVNYER